MTLSSPAPTAVAEARWRAVSAEHGIAALRHTHWLDTTARAYEGAPGEWRAEGGRVVGTGVVGDGEASLAPGEQLDVGRLRLKAFERGGALALRVLDPQAPARLSLRGIHSFAGGEEWVFPGVFTPADEGEKRVVSLVDGYESEEDAIGTIALDLAGEPVELTVSRAGTGFSAVIADGTSNVDAYRFRFLPIAAPDDDGRVVVDFNRAFLPPCAFSDQYVCPLPPAGNRLRVRIEAGERSAERD